MEITGLRSDLPETAICAVRSFILLGSITFTTAGLHSLYDHSLFFPRSLDGDFDGG
jgi:hypothetical protein